MKILLHPVASQGNVLPFVALGRALQRRGRCTRCAQVAQQMVADLAAGQGIAAVCDAELALPNRHAPVAPPG